MHLLPFQFGHAARVLAALTQKGVAADLSDPGTGKTYIACHVAREGGWAVVVIAPKAVLPVWQKVASLFGTKVLVVLNYEKVKRGNAGLGHFEGKRFVWTLPKGVLLVFDEAQRCKARGTQNAELLIAARRQGIRMLLLSATAASNPLEMRAIGYALGLHSLWDFWRWAIQHGCFKGRFGFEFSGDADVLQRLHRRVFHELGVGSRLRIADIPEFPETTIEAVPIGTGHERQIQAVYDQMARDLSRAKAQGDSHTLESLAAAMDAKAPNHLTILLRARQAVEALKLDAMASLAMDGVAEGQSVALFLNFDHSLDRLSEALGCNCIIRGGQSEEERAEAIHRFQANESPYILCNIKAGGVGVSLHDPAGGRPRLALISPTFSAQDLRQALGRVHRAGGGHSIQKVIFAAGTCEERACDAVNQKLLHIDALNDGDLVPSFLQS